MALIRKELSTQGNHKLSTAVQYLSEFDPILSSIITQIGPCGLTRRRRYFAVLCDSIISQQLSLAVATVIYERFASLYPRKSPTPAAVADTSIGLLRSVGLSHRKAEYLKDLAAGFRDRRLVMRNLVREPNEAIIVRLTSIRGIGRWTAEMFLIFSLNRLDVLPLGDLGIQKGLQRWYDLSGLPSKQTIQRLAKPWHPYESVACWYLWRSLALPPCNTLK